MTPEKPKSPTRLARLAHIDKLYNFDPEDTRDPKPDPFQGPYLFDPEDPFESDFLPKNNSTRSSLPNFSDPEYLDDLP